MTTQAPDAAPQEGSIAMTYNGTNHGTISYHNTARGSDAGVYRGSVSRNQAHVHPDDVLFLEGTGRWKRTPKAEQSSTLPNPLAPITSDETGTPSLADLGLSKAALDGFAAANITTVAQANALSDESLDSIPGVGESTITKIREAA